MRTVLNGEPPAVVQAWLDRRRELGQDLFDEVWEGEYHVAPNAHSRHGLVDQQLAELLGPPARRAGLIGSGPLNLGVSDNYRVPDRAFLWRPPTTAFVPSAAIVVEILSPGDETYAKFGFYFARGVEELLVVDPLSRRVEWYARGTDGFVRTDRSALLGLTERALADAIDWPGAE